MGNLNNILSTIRDDLLIAIANSAKDLVVIADVKRDITFVNQSICQKTGYKMKELIGRKIPILHHKENRSKYTAKIFKSLHENGRWNGEMEIKKKDGTSLWTYATIFSFYDGEGKPAGTVGIGHDLSDQRLLEQHVWESEQRLPYVIESMEDAIFVTDLKGNIVMCNEAHCRLLGYRKDEIVGRTPPYPWVEQSDVMKLRQGFKILLKEEKLKNYTLAWKKRDQSRIVVSLSLSLLRTRAKVPQGFVITVRDVSEVHYIEELHRSYERIQRLSLDVKRKAQRLKTLEEVNLLVMKNADIFQIFKSITQGIKKLVDHDLAGIYIYDPKKEVLLPNTLSKQTVFSRKLAKFPLTLGKGIIGEAALTGKMVMVNNAQHDPRSQYPPGMKPEKEHFIGVPLKGRKALFGVLVVARNRDPEFIEEEAMLIESFAQAATVALENARLYDELDRS